MDDCRKLLEFIPRGKEPETRREAEMERSSFEERKLELRLGPPGDLWPSQLNENSVQDKKIGHESLPSAGCCFTNVIGHHSAEWLNHQPQPTFSSFLESSSESLLRPRYSKASTDLHIQNCSSEFKGFSVPSSLADINVATANLSQKRTAPGPVVGWPPIRSFRKNLAGSVPSKSVASEIEKREVPKSIINEEPTETNNRRMFTKVNMDGILIGRKVDLSAYDSYEKLASAVDELFRGLLAAQNDPSPGGARDKDQEAASITGLLNGSGEYTLVYEDNEGDRMLVGDVPWNMFVSTVKRLRVLKSSDVSALSRAGHRTKATTLLLE